MWNRVYDKVYKTSDSDLIITAVCSFPNINDTLEKVIEFYKVKQLQQSKKYLEIMSDFEHENGRYFVPLYFEDQVPKLAKLQKLKPIGKGWFWCVGYKNPNLTIKGKHACSFLTPPYKWYKSRLKIWLKEYHTEYSSVTSHLFKQAIKMWIYENTKDFSGKEKNRRFKLIENSNLSIDEYKFSPEDYLIYLRAMEQANVYEFMFKSFV